jgi:NTE family protein
MAGGGALGAFQAGVLRYVMDELAGELGRPLGFELFAGTSIGALNAAFLAANGDRPAEAVRQLVGYWESLSVERVLRFRGRELVALLQMLLGATPRRVPRRSSRARIEIGASHPPVAGLFDTALLFEEMRSLIPWARLQENLRSGRVHGVAFCATEICTGSAVIFYQTAKGREYLVGRDPWKTARRVTIGVEHAMASAAIPFLFPAVQVGGVCYTDGALRQNTPLNPALRMGADRVLVVSLTQDPRIAARIARAGCRLNPYPGLLFLLGRAVNVLLTESLDYELNRVALYNRLIAGGCQAFGDGFLDQLNAIMGGARNARYRPVRTCHIRPSRDLDDLAAEALRSAPDELALPGLSGQAITRLMRSAAFAETELLAFLSFTPTFIRALLELGFRDARAHRDELMRFFSE